MIWQEWRAGAAFAPHDVSSRQSLDDTKGFFFFLKEKETTNNNENSEDAGYCLRLFVCLFRWGGESREENKKEWTSFLENIRDRYWLDREILARFWFFSRFCYFFFVRVHVHAILPPTLIFGRRGCVYKGLSGSVSLMADAFQQHIVLRRRLPVAVVLEIDWPNVYYTHALERWIEREGKRGR
jgi:hypothetical protein